VFAVVGVLGAGAAVAAVTTGTDVTALFPAPAEPAADMPAESDPVLGGVAGEQQAATVEAEDNRILDVVDEARPGQSPFEVATTGLPTVVLPATTRPYGLADLQRSAAVEKLSDGSWLLRRSVAVTRGAELRLHMPGGTLRMSSGPDGFATLIGFKGSLALAGDPGAPLRISSWNPATQAPDTDAADGRAYIREIGGRMDITQVEVSDLGFWSGRTGGVAWTGSTGEPATGSATAVLVERGHYGMFSSRTDGLVLAQSTLRDNELDGLLLHRDTTGLVARTVTSTGNGRDGIAATRGAQAITLTQVVASSNGAQGIRIDGTPLATGPTADGAGTSHGTGYTVEGSRVADNQGVGLLVRGADDVRLAANTVTGNRDGIVAQGARQPEIVDNVVDHAEFAIAVRDGVQDAQIVNNRIGTAVIGIQVIDATATLRANTVSAASHYGVSLVGEVDGSTVTGNVLAGRGPNAVDRSRANLVAPGGGVEALGIDDNDDAGWTTDRDEIQYWRGYIADHPLLLLWLLILLLPIFARLWFTRRRSARESRRHPYDNAAPGPPVATLLPDDGSQPTTNETRVSVLSPGHRPK
jgi:hypothetical protein